MPGRERVLVRRTTPLLMGALSLASCSPAADVDPLAALAALAAEAGEVVFLAQNVAPEAVMEALFVGRVILDGRGCLRLGSAESATVVWPMGFALERTGDALRVRSADGREIGRIGGEFRFGGGEVPSLHQGFPLAPADRELARERCPGRYWLVGDVPGA